MRSITRRTLSVALVFALTLGVFAAFPQTARADSANDIADYINNTFQHGGTGTLSASVTALNTVTVTGSVTGATATLDLRLDDGVTVDWQAEYSGNTAGSLLMIRTTNLADTGALLVSDGWIENTGSGNAIRTQDFDVQITVSGGTVSAASGRAIYSDYASAQISVSGGTVSSASGRAIVALGNNAQVTVSGGTVSADAGDVNVIRVEGTLNISGGKVDVANNSSNAMTIYARNITITGGDVIAANSGSGDAIYAGNSLAITGGRVLASAGGSDLYGGNTGISIGGNAVVGYDDATQQSGGAPAINTAGGSAIAYKPNDMPNVTVAASPIGGGTANVSFTDARGNTVTSANFWQNSFVPVVAAASPGYVFIDWTSTTPVTFDSSTSLSTSFTMPAGTADATANFTDLRITGFAIAGQIGQTAINHATGTITVTMPYGTSLSALTPTITIPAGASVNPASGAAHDFSNAVQYTVSNGVHTKAYTVTVTAAPPPYSGGDSYTPSNSLRIVNNIITITQLSNTSVRLGVQATGGYPPYTYRYQMKGSWIDIPGATSAEFDWTGLTPGQAYTVRCVVKDRLGNTVTSPEKTFIAGEGLSTFPVKGEITSKNVNVRPEPNTKGKALGKLQTGGEVSILGYTAPKGYAHGFYKIAWDNAAGYAYISADYVSVTFTTPQDANITGRAYLQSQMNTAKKYRVATLSNGNTAKLLGRYKTWWVVEWQGERAYLKNGKYIQP